MFPYWPEAEYANRQPQQSAEIRHNITPPPHPPQPQQRQQQWNHAGSGGLHTAPPSVYLLQSPLAQSNHFATPSSAGNSINTASTATTQQRPSHQPAPLLSPELLSPLQPPTAPVSIAAPQLPGAASIYLNEAPLFSQSGRSDRILSGGGGAAAPYGPAGLLSQSTHSSMSNSGHMRIEEASTCGTSYLCLSPSSSRTHSTPSQQQQQQLPPVLLPDVMERASPLLQNGVVDTEEIRLAQERPFRFKMLPPPPSFDRFLHLWQANAAPEVATPPAACGEVTGLVDHRVLTAHLGMLAQYRRTLERWWCYMAVFEGKDEVRQRLGGLYLCPAYDDAQRALAGDDAASPAAAEPDIAAAAARAEERTLRTWSRLAAQWWDETRRRRRPRRSRRSSRRGTGASGNVAAGEVDIVGPELQSGVKADVEPQTFPCAPFGEWPAANGGAAPEQESSLSFNFSNHLQFGSAGESS